MLFALQRSIVIFAKFSVMFWKFYCLLRSQQISQLLCMWQSLPDSAKSLASVVTVCCPINISCLLLLDCQRRGTGHLSAFERRRRRGAKTTQRNNEVAVEKRQSQRQPGDVRPQYATATDSIGMSSSFAGRRRRRHERSFKDRWKLRQLSSVFRIPRRLLAPFNSAPWQRLLSQLMHSFAV
jgi:hypothetical protein